MPQRETTSKSSVTRTTSSTPPSGQDATPSEVRARDEVRVGVGNSDNKGDRPTPWMTTGQALKYAAKKGWWTKSRPTFDRAVRNERLPQELIDAGLVADWQAKGQQGKNNATWLRFE